MSNPMSIFMGFSALVIVVVPNLMVCRYMLNRNARHAVIPPKPLRNPVNTARGPGDEKPLRAHGLHNNNWIDTPTRYHCGHDAPCIGQWFIPADMCARCSANGVISPPHRPITAIEPVPAMPFGTIWGDTTSPQVRAGMDFSLLPARFTIHSQDKAHNRTNP